MLFARLLRPMILSLAVFGFSTNARAQDTFQGLGELTSGTYSTATAVSADGSTIVGYSNGEAFRWTSGGGMVGMGTLPGAGASIANSISSDGSVIAGYVQRNNFDTEAFRWTSQSGMVGLGDLPGGILRSRALGVSGDGSVIVGNGTRDEVGDDEAFRYTASEGMVGLGNVGDYNPNLPSSATAISANGSVIVGWSDSTDGFQAFRWSTADGMIGLGDFAGGIDWSEANAVSADGSTIVGVGTSFQGADAFRWTSTTGLVSLGDLPGGVFRSEALGVSADGSIIVGFSDSYSGFAGFIWDSQQGMRNLRDVLVSDFGLNLHGWSLTRANGISADGLTIVGEGVNPSGLSEAWRVSVDAKWMNGSSGQWDDRSNWVFGISPNELHDLMITPENGLTVIGPSQTTTLKSLQLGAQNGTATLQVNTAGSINVLGTTTIESGGRLAGSGTFASGNVTNLGRIELDQLQLIGPLVNFGVVSGSGEIAGNFFNANGAETRVDSGQTLRLTGDGIINAGVIRSIGGEIIVDSLVQNSQGTGLIVGRDATFQFNGGVENLGSMGFSFGTSDVFGDITNDRTGIINVSGGANVTFYDDVLQNGEMIVAKIGDNTSSVVMFGEFSGAGGFTGGGDVFAFGDLRPGNSPASVLMDGNLFLGSSTDSLFELGGLEIGEFDQLLVTGDLSLAGELAVETIDGFRLKYNDEFLIADVGGILGGQFFGLGEGDWVTTLNGIDLFISYSAGDGNDVLLFSSVPEPNLFAFGMMLIAAVSFSRCRRKPLNRPALT